MVEYATNMKNAVEVKNLSKLYVIGEKEKYLALRDVIIKILKAPLNILKGKGFKKKSTFWALKDVNFNIKEGEVVGIIGRNGAGKSTLLKVLSRITEPTEGSVRMNGRVSSLLEVGTGFHPELTGRENIYLNGAILGMSRKEIDKKFKEIVEFSGVEKFLDMPVKRYSSGMQVRLAFSVAAHLEPDILIIDEVLAVGDAEFQKKCLGKMDEVTKSGGRTVIFVSHDMGAIQRLCKNTILLEGGSVAMYGPTSDVIKHYVSNLQLFSDKEYVPIDGEKVFITRVTVKDTKGNTANSVDYDKPFRVDIKYRVVEPVPNLQLAIICDGAFGGRAFSTASSDDKILISQTPGEHNMTYSFPKPEGIFLNPGLYMLRVSIGSQNGSAVSSVDDISINITSSSENPISVHQSRKQNINIIQGKWEN